MYHGQEEDPREYLPEGIEIVKPTKTKNTGKSQAPKGIFRENPELFSLVSSIFTRSACIMGFRKVHSFPKQNLFCHWKCASLISQK
jgi:hypothetical protein